MFYFRSLLQAPCRLLAKRGQTLSTGMRAGVLVGLFCCTKGNSHAESPHLTLLNASEEGNLTLAAAAVEAGANVSFREYTPQGVRTPLAWAVKARQGELVSYLMANGAEVWPDLQDPSETPGCLAAKQGGPALAAMLSKLPANPPLKLLECLAEHLSRRGMAAEVKQLEAHGLRPEHTTDAGGAPFLWALEEGDLDSANALFEWAAQRLRRRQDIKLDATRWFAMLSRRPWQEAAAEEMLDRMKLYGVQLTVAEHGLEATLGALANRYRLRRLAAKLNWTGNVSPAYTKEDHAVFAGLLPKSNLREQFYQEATGVGASGPNLASRILAAYFASPHPFSAAEAKIWLDRGASFDGLVDVPHLGRTTAAACVLTSGVDSKELAARFQWLKENGCNLLQNLRLTGNCGVDAVKALFHWAGPPRGPDAEALLANLILWHSEDRHWNLEIRQLIQFLVDNKATLTRSPLAVEALNVLARRPEPRILAATDVLSQKKEIVANYRTRQGSRYPGLYFVELEDRSISVTLDPDGQAIMTFSSGPVFGSWQEDDVQATLNTPTRSYFLRLNVEDDLEMRMVRWQQLADFKLERKAEKQADKATVNASSSPNAGNLVDLSGRKLDALPETDAAWQDVKTLLLSDNRLRQIPSALLSQTTLTTLVAKNNWLKSLDLKNSAIQLHELDLSGNGFSSSLPWLKNCPNLKVLRLAENRFSQVPVEDLAHCKNLEVLDLSGNMLTEFPISLLQSLPKLRELRLGSNRFTSVATLLLQAPLETLDLGNNRIPFEQIRGPVAAVYVHLTGMGYSANELASLARRYPGVKWKGQSVLRAAAEDQINGLAHGSGGSGR